MGAAPFGDRPSKLQDPNMWLRLWRRTVENLATFPDLTLQVIGTLFPCPKKRQWRQTANRRSTHIRSCFHCPQLCGSTERTSPWWCGWQCCSSNAQCPLCMGRTQAASRITTQTGQRGPPTPWQSWLTQSAQILVDARTNWDMDWRRDADWWSDWEKGTCTHTPQPQPQQTSGLSPKHIGPMRFGSLWGQRHNLIVSVSSILRIKSLHDNLITLVFSFPTPTRL